MSLLRPDDQILSAHIADVHYSHDVPVNRIESTRGQWYDYMEMHTQRLYSFLKAHKITVLTISGDIFHKWNSPPELINFVMKMFKNFKAEGISILAVPGQHDLPMHNYEDIKKSAYWSLVEAGVIQTLRLRATVVRVGGEEVIQFHGFPWGTCLTESSHMGAFGKGIPKIALIHDYCFNKENGNFPGVSLSKHTFHWSNLLALHRFDCAFFGDNHLGFVHKSTGAPWIYNCGAFLKRKTDDNPCTSIGLLCKTGLQSMSVRTINLHNEPNSFKTAATKKVKPDYLQVIEGFRQLAKTGEKVLDFVEHLLRDIHNENNDMNPEIRDYLLTKIEELDIK